MQQISYSVHYLVQASMKFHIIHISVSAAFSIMVPIRYRYSKILSIYVTISAKTHLVRTIKKFFF